MEEESQKTKQNKIKPKLFHSMLWGDVTAELLTISQKQKGNKQLCLAQANCRKEVVFDLDLHS